MENTNYAQFLSERILALRKGKGLTQEALAQRLGVSFQAVSKWENGQSCPDIALLPLLADIFAVPIDSLFGREPEPPAAVQQEVEPATEPVFPYYGQLPLPSGEPLHGGTRAQPAKPSRILLPLLLIVLLFIMPFLLLAVGAVLTKAGVASNAFFGLRFYSVFTSSMEPTMKADGIIIVRPCKPENVQVNDIITYRITYQSEDSICITHRLVEIMMESYGKTGLWFITKGDNNPTADPPVSAEQLVGKVVFTLRGLGRLLMRFGVFLPIALLSFPLCWILAVFVVIWMALRGRRGSRRRRDG